MRTNPPGKSSTGRLGNWPGANSRKVQPASTRADELGRALKQAYVMERRALDSMLSGQPSRYFPSASLDGINPDPGDTPERTPRENQWVKQALALMELKLDPVEYVHVIFQAIYGKAVDVPQVAQLSSPRWVELYREAVGTVKQKMLNDFHTQNTIAIQNITVTKNLRRLSMEAATAVVIGDQTISLSGLFRYCLARSLKGPQFRELADRYQVVAAIQYVRNRDNYDELWGDFIPDDFKLQAPRIYDKYVKYLTS